MLEEMGSCEGGSVLRRTVGLSRLVSLLLAVTGPSACTAELEEVDTETKGWLQWTVLGLATRPASTEKTRQMRGKEFEGVIKMQ